MEEFLKQAAEVGLKIKTNFPLCSVTTIGIGGPARWYCEITNVEQLIRLVALTRQFNVPFKVIGKGGNILFSDSGFDGLIVHNQIAELSLLPEKPSQKKPTPFPEYLSQANRTYQPVLVQVASGMRLSTLINKLHRMDIVGLEYFAGIPATVGGSIYMNAHGGPYFFGQFVQSARLFDGQNLKEVPADYFDFAYDYSKLQITEEIIIDTALCLWQGPVEAAQNFFRLWTKYKRNQPQKSAGCIFQNLSPEQQQRLNLPTPSVGYFIDKLLHLKGVQKGGARISLAHAAFIENLGRASANDVLWLINLVKNKARTEFDIDLKLEIELIGF